MQQRRYAAAFAGALITVVLVYLLALARFCTAWAALETGSAFEGMGAAREVSYAVLAEAGLSRPDEELAALKDQRSTGAEQARKEKAREGRPQPKRGAPRKRAANAPSAT